MKVRNDVEFIKFVDLKNETFKKQVKKWSDDKIKTYIDKFDENDKDIIEMAKNHFNIKNQKGDDYSDSFLLTRVYLFQLKNS